MMLEFLKHGERILSFDDSTHIEDEVTYNLKIETWDIFEISYSISDTSISKIIQDTNTITIIISLKSIVSNSKLIFHFRENLMVLK